MNPASWIEKNRPTRPGWVSRLRNGNNSFDSLKGDFLYGIDPSFNITLNKINIKAGETQVKRNYLTDIETIQIYRTVSGDLFRITMYGTTFNYSSGSQVHIVQLQFLFNRILRLRAAASCFFTSGNGIPSYTSFGVRCFKE